MFSRIGSFAARFRWFIIAGWIALAVFILCFIYAPVANGGL